VDLPDHGRISQADSTIRAFELAAWLCRWGSFSRIPPASLFFSDADVEQHFRLAVLLANEATDAEMAKNWNCKADPHKDFLKHDLNPLASYYHTQAIIHRERYQSQRITSTSKLNLSENYTIGIVSALPRQPERKVCMTCGGNTKGVIYCSDQCRPSAVLEWYSIASDRAETSTMTEGFRTARSRFLTPSAASQASFDSSQFVPPPYALEDANPSTPRFVPTYIKEEGLDEEDLEPENVNVDLPARNSYFSNQARLPSIHTILKEVPKGSGIPMAPLVEPATRLQGSFWSGALSPVHERPQPVHRFDRLM
jgi:hypothetical protein